MPAAEPEHGDEAPAPHRPSNPNLHPNPDPHHNPNPNPAPNRNPKPKPKPNPNRNPNPDPMPTPTLTQGAREIPEMVDANALRNEIRAEIEKAKRGCDFGWISTRMLWMFLCLELVALIVLLVISVRDHHQRVRVRDGADLGSD